MFIKNAIFILTLMTSINTVTSSVSAQVLVEDQESTLEKTVTLPNVDEVEESLMNVPSIYRAQWQAVLDYAESINYVVRTKQVYPTQSPLRESTRDFGIEFVLVPADLADGEPYHLIRTSIYFSTPSHYERTMGLNKYPFNFVRIETVTDYQSFDPRQPGGISSAG